MSSVAPFQCHEASVMEVYYFLDRCVPKYLFFGVILKGIYFPVSFSESYEGYCFLYIDFVFCNFTVFTRYKHFLIGSIGSGETCGISTELLK